MVKSTKSFKSYFLRIVPLHVLSVSPLARSTPMDDRQIVWSTNKDHQIFDQKDRYKIIIQHLLGHPPERNSSSHLSFFFAFVEISINIQNYWDIILNDHKWQLRLGDEWDKLILWFLNPNWKNQLWTGLVCVGLRNVPNLIFLHLLRNIQNSSKSFEFCSVFHSKHQHQIVSAASTGRESLYQECYYK